MISVELEIVPLQLALKLNEHAQVFRKAEHRVKYASFSSVLSVDCGPVINQDGQMELRCNLGAPKIISPVNLKK